jgi:hypothetical protein
VLTAGVFRNSNRVGALPANPPSQRCNYFDIKGCGANKGAKAQWIEVLLRQWRCVIICCANYDTVLKLEFFLVETAALFTLRTFGAQINWLVISRKVLFDPYRFSSNKSPSHFAGESGNENTFRNGKRKRTSIATVPDLFLTTVNILTHLISRYQYQLPTTFKQIRAL